MLKNTHGEVKKQTLLNRFLAGFNSKFNLLEGKYKNLVTTVVNRRVVTVVVLIAFCLGTWGLSKRSEERRVGKEC